MTKLIFSFLLLISFSAFAQEPTVINDVNAQTRTVTSSFTGISVSDGIELVLTQGTEEKIVVSASEEKYRDKIKTDVVDGLLKIYYEHDSKLGIHINTKFKKNLKAYVSIITLSKLQASAGAAVTISGSMTATDLIVKASSGATISAALKAQNLDVDQSSGSRITITGTITKLNVDVSSGASFNSYDLATDYCNAKTSSGAGIKVTIAKELTAKASSGGSVRYKGEGIIKQVNVSSGGSVKKA